MKETWSKRADGTTLGYVLMLGMADGGRNGAACNTPLSHLILPQVWLDTRLLMGFSIKEGILLMWPEWEHAIVPRGMLGPTSSSNTPSISPTEAGDPMSFTTGTLIGERARLTRSAVALDRFQPLQTVISNSWLSSLQTVKNKLLTLRDFKRLVKPESSRITKNSSTSAKNAWPVCTVTLMEKRETGQEWASTTTDMLLI